MELPNGVDLERLRTLLRLAREEDLGSRGDITTALLPEHLRDGDGQWVIRLRTAGRFCGRALLPIVLAELAPQVRLDWIDGPDEGRDLAAGAPVAGLSGRVGQMLAAERTILNLLGRLSGIATRTREFVARVAGTHAKVFDTRKTLPGWRDLERYAVRCGGGHNHRSGLYDAVLIKDNHLAGIPTDRLAHAVFEMLNRLERQLAQPAFVEVEADSLEQLDELLKVVGIDVILLDNFEPAAAAEAVRRRDALGLRGKVELEASGGISLENIGLYAAARVERISVGSMTHSAPALDVALDALA